MAAEDAAWWLSTGADINGRNPEENRVAGGGSGSVFFFGIAILHSKVLEVVKAESQTLDTNYSGKRRRSWKTTEEERFPGQITSTPVISQFLVQNVRTVNYDVVFEIFTHTPQLRDGLDTHPQ